ncbi:hypothetical protein [Streptomyces sp. NPDC048172]|uniref:hypothetical protein n=1 Tax=Streptomyces sp. NPDC048172 TaxID=3365505 RepID=UPI00371804FF
MSMSHRARAWAWTGGVWLALCLTGAGATLALQPPDGPSPGDPRDRRPSLSPTPRLPDVDELGKGCQEAEAEARRRAERNGPDDYSFVCLEVGSTPTVP